MCRTWERTVMDRHGKLTPQQVEGVLWKWYSMSTQGFACQLPELMEQTAPRVSASKQEGDVSNFLMVLPSELWMDLEKREERSWALLSYCFYIKICEVKGTRRRLENCNVETQRSKLVYMD